MAGASEAGEVVKQNLASVKKIIKGRMIIA